MMSRKKKSEKTIVYLRTDLGAEDLVAGGSVAHTYGVLRALQELNKNIICASSAMLPMLSKMSFKEFCVLKMPRFFSCIGFRLNCFVSNFFFTLKLGWSLRNWGGDELAFIYQRYSLLNCVGVILSWYKKIPLVLEFNGSEVWIDKHWQGKGRVRIRFLIRWIERLNLRFAHTIVVVSQVLKDSLVKQGVSAEKILVNPNGVDTSVFQPGLKISRYNMRNHLGIDGKFVFGFIGTFSAWHGIETIAAMIPQVCKICPDAHFLLIGSGPLLQYLKNELKSAGVGPEFVTMTGIIEQEGACSYLDACDAFLSPTKQNSDGSRFFGSPTKIFEYMSLVKPIIASDLEQLSELLCPALRPDCLDDDCCDKAGILVSPDDLQGFVRAACAVVNMDKNKRKMLGRNARKKVVKQYSWRHHTKKILRAVNEKR